MQHCQLAFAVSNLNTIVRMEKQIDREKVNMERQKDKKTKRQKVRKTERQRGRKAERQKDRKKKRQHDRNSEEQ